MRKLIVSMNITLDGFLSGPSSELDWHFEHWSNDMAEVLATQLAEADTILLGRNTYSAMAAYWLAMAKDISCPRSDIALVCMMNNYTKIVVSSSTALPKWGNTSTITGDLEKEITNLKSRNGNAIMLYGSATLVPQLIKLQLVDEYQLWIHPVLIGKGKPLFKGLDKYFPMNLVRSQVFASGVVLLVYQCSQYIQGLN